MTPSPSDRRSGTNLRLPYPRNGAASSNAGLPLWKTCFGPSWHHPRQQVATPENVPFQEDGQSPGEGATTSASAADGDSHRHVLRQGAQSVAAVIGTHTPILRARIWSASLSCVAPSVTAVRTVGLVPGQWAGETARVPALIPRVWLRIIDGTRQLRQRRTGRPLA